jgi:hypothetical protein
VDAFISFSGFSLHVDIRSVSQSWLLWTCLFSLINGLGPHI